MDASIIAEAERVAEAETNTAEPTAAASVRTATCAPLPEPDANAARRNLDLDHDGISDFLIPTDCEGRQNCTIHLFLNHDPCPVPLGDIGVEPSVLGGRGIYDLAVIAADLAWHRAHPHERGRSSFSGRGRVGMEWQRLDEGERCVDVVGSRHG